MNTAYQAGRKAGLLMLSPSLNYYPDGSGDSEQWELGWRQAVALRLLEKDTERKIKKGWLAASACTEIGT